MAHAEKLWLAKCFARSGILVEESKSEKNYCDNEAVHSYTLITDLLSLLVVSFLELT